MTARESLGIFGVLLLTSVAVSVVLAVGMAKVWPTREQAMCVIGEPGCVVTR